MSIETMSSALESSRLVRIACKARDVSALRMISAGEGCSAFFRKAVLSVVPFNKNKRVAAHLPLQLDRQSPVALSRQAAQPTMPRFRLISVEDRLERGPRIKLQAGGAMRASAAASSSSTMAKRKA